MPWIRIDDHAPEHPKMLRAGPTACWLWVCGLAYCSRHLTDGDIPSEALLTLGVPKVQDAVSRLLREGLWDELATGYHVHDYHDYQPSKAQVAERRKRTAERVAEWKRKHGYACDNAPDNAVTNPAPVPDPVPPPDPVPQEPVPEGEGADAPAPADQSVAETGGLTPERLGELWHTLTADDMPDCLAFAHWSEVRIRSARTRIREHPDEAFWSDVIQRINASPFCRGQNDRKWTASIDWLLKPDTAAKVLEGKYDRRMRMHL